MAQNSKIEWTDHTANLWWGCTEVHAGCDNCYARVLAHRWGFEVWGADSGRRIINSFWKDVARFQKLAEAAGAVHRVFVGSMMDIFEKSMPVINEKGDALVGVHTDVGFIGPVKDNDDLTTGHLRNKFFQQIDEGKYPNLLFLLLTKRPSNINKYIPESWKENPPANVMFGTSPVDEKTAEKLIPQLLQVNGKRFLSIEPMLGPINLRHIDADRGGSPEWCQIDCLTGRHTDMARPCADVPTIDWVICGGESGQGARPMHPDWTRSIRDQCNAAGVPFLFKQWGEFLPFEETAQPPFHRNCATLEEHDGHGMNFMDHNGDEGKWNGGKWLDGFNAYLMCDNTNSNHCMFLKVGKKSAGRLLDGIEHNCYPKK